MADGATPDERVSIVLDGKTIEATKGEMIIAAAERTGTYIPRFCYHPRMKPVGMCRMCLVEVKGPRGFSLQPACYMAVADGQEVVTNSPKVKKAQDGVLEFLLINHPLDCPVCDKGGECPLQDQTLTYGPGETRMVEEKRHWEKPIPLSDLVLIDRERCIQCARCTRFADEIGGDPLIDFVNRGDSIEVNTFPDQPFASYFSGNTVQICPVGALLATPYRFKARPWDLEQVESTCTSCAVGCRIAVQSSGDRLTRYIGIDSDPVNQGWLCDKGRFDYEAINSDDRISTPRVNKNGEFVEVSWAEALDAAATSLRDAGPAAIGVIGGARLANEDAYAWAKLVKGVIGSDNVDCQLGDGLPADVVLGLPRATIDDACRASAVVVLGADIKEELPVLYLRLRQAAVEDKLPIHEVASHATGLTKYTASSRLYRPGEAVAAARELAGRLGDEDDVVIVLGRPSLGESGDLIAAAVGEFVQALPNARYLSALRRSNVHGALDMGLAPGVLPGRVTLEDGRDWYSEAWPTVPGTDGRDTTEMLRAAADGSIQTLVLLGADPLADFPDRALARLALESARFVIAVDCFQTESTAQADVFLPAATFAERPGTTTNLEGRITRLGQKITAPGVAWPDWMIASELAFRLGRELGFESIDDIWDEIERLAPSHAGITRAVVADRRNRDGVVAPLRDGAAGVVPGTGRPGGGEAVHSGATDVGAGSTQAVPGPIDPMATPGIRSVETQGDPVTSIASESAATAAEGAATEAAATAAAAAAVADNAEPAEPVADGEDEAGDEDEVQVEVEPVATGPSRPALLRFTGMSAPAVTEDAYSLRLVSSRKLYDQGTFVQHAEHLAPLAATAELFVHPADLERLGLPAGGAVRLHAAATSLTTEARPDAGLPRGSVFLGFNLRGEQAADLIDATAPVTDVRIESPS